MKKGLELPINMIVVIAIAVLVLVVVAAVFSGYFTTNTNTIGVEQAWNKACQQVMINNCNPGALGNTVLYQQSGSSSATDTPIRTICGLKLGASAPSDNDCLRACGCVVSG